MSTCTSCEFIDVSIMLFCVVQIDLYHFPGISAGITAPWIMQLDDILTFSGLPVKFELFPINF